MSETVYLETSILGYLTARLTRNLVLVASIEVTREWWESHRGAFTLYVSQVVLDEVGTGSLRGDTELKALLYKVFTGLASKTRKYRLCKGLRCFITR